MVGLLECLYFYSASGSAYGSEATSSEVVDWCGDDGHHVRIGLCVGGQSTNAFAAFGAAEGYCAEGREREGDFTW